jgi:hypothetical protein
MRLQIRLSDLRAARILVIAASQCLLFLFCSLSTAGQVTPNVEPGELYAGIEISTEELRAAAFRISSRGGEPGVRLIHSEVVHLTPGRLLKEKSAPQAVGEVANIIQVLLSQLEVQHEVPAEHIYLIGSNELRIESHQDLVDALIKTTGKTLTFLDTETEVQLSIVGTIPQRVKVGGRWIDNRDSSVLIEIGSDSTMGGYQSLKYPPSGPPRYGSVTMKIDQGTLSFAGETSLNNEDDDDLPAYLRRVRESGMASFRLALRKEQERKPGLVSRKRVYLMGDIVWALALLLHPEERQTFIRLTSSDIARFARKIAVSPQQPLNLSLSHIRQPKLRAEVESELEILKNTITPKQLIAGAEMLRALSEELKWRDKSLWFARFGHLSRILTYLRLQAEK